MLEHRKKKRLEEKYLKKVSHFLGWLILFLLFSRVFLLKYVLDVLGW